MDVTNGQRFCALQSFAGDQSIGAHFRGADEVEACVIEAESGG